MTPCCIWGAYEPNATDQGSNYGFVRGGKFGEVPVDVVSWVDVYMCRMLEHCCVLHDFSTVLCKARAVRRPPPPPHSPDRPESRKLHRHIAWTHCKVVRGCPASNSGGGFLI